MHHTLIVANRTAATPVLLQEIDRRAEFRRTAFTLLVPDATPSNWRLEDAVNTLRDAAAGINGTRPTWVDGIANASEDPFEAVKSAVETGEYDDIVVSTLPSRTSVWLKRDLPRRVEALGLPVAVITPATSHGFSLFAKGPGSYESGR
ncbi:hypothetical protein DVA67_012835 [Solirubrobacter sp. CPCC 204708]|uniref:Universal stress protein n=1 Tax=Solirubrobacter deserti TaxID=2282478 RepID=A0ABT4RK34_9ACTN|nr:hypothetical protein [Solirubrobacter deserti]MBE2316860.1 hypothetical protein [Solirubrobacter deserti]MDA0138923.1 hypothetical protein [Solirubrobacter deserti]